MSTSPPATAIDAHDPRRARQAPGLLRAFNDIGVLSAADVHVAVRLTSLAGEPNDLVALGAAFAARGPRFGHVLVDLATIRSTAAVDADEPVDLSALPWPEPEAWVARLAESPLVGVGEDTEPNAARPLRLIGTTLYLDRYWREEREVAADLLTFADGEPATVDEAVLADGLNRLFTGEVDDRQRMAAATAVLRRFAVVAGGPGTGKTTTVARIVALLAEQAAAAGDPPPLIALAAPTGKAAARLEEAVHAEAATFDIADTVRARLLDLHASTLHRLLGWRPGSHSRFRHQRTSRLPHDVVIVDETSMVSLSLMARLVESVRPDARLVLVGDPGQLTSIEAGAVLGDIIGLSTASTMMRAPGSVSRARRSSREIATGSEPLLGTGIRDGIVVLDRVHRFGGGIALIAEAIRRGDADEVMAILATQSDDLTWIPVDVADHDAEAQFALAAVREEAVAAGRGLVAAAKAGAAHEAIAALGAFRVLCAHRRGADGVAAWTAKIESWLAAAIPSFDPAGPTYVGRPLLVTENDHELRLYNGDTGVVVQTNRDRVSAAFERGGELIEFTPTRLSSIETAFAMTIHKSQGSQFNTAVVLLPRPTWRILTRELLHTAATRARARLILVGDEGAIRAGVTRPVARASGLGRRLGVDATVCGWRD